MSSFYLIQTVENTNIKKPQTIENILVKFTSVAQLVQLFADFLNSSKLYLMQIKIGQTSKKSFQLLFLQQVKG